jgi:hypothetical protein
MHLAMLRKTFIVRLLHHRFFVAEMARYIVIEFADNLGQDFLQAFQAVKPRCIIDKELRDLQRSPWFCSISFRIHHRPKITGKSWQHCARQVASSHSGCEQLPEHC